MRVRVPRIRFQWSDVCLRDFWILLVSALVLVAVVRAEVATSNAQDAADAARKATIDNARLSRETARLAKRNTLAIRVGCTLITNAVLESGAGGAARHATSEAAKAQQELTAIYIAVISRGMRPTELARARALAARIRRFGGVVSVPDCKRIALHPEEVKELALPTGPPSARRSSPADGKRPG